MTKKIPKQTSSSKPQKLPPKKPNQKGGAGKKYKGVHQQTHVEDAGQG